MKIAGWKSERIGRTGCIRSTGVAYEKASDAIMSSQPDAIICRSELRAPSSESAESVYAEMIDSSIIVCCCCSAESSVQRPCRTRSTTARTCGARDEHRGTTTRTARTRTARQDEPRRLVRRRDRPLRATGKEPPGMPARGRPTTARARSVRARDAPTARAT